MHRLDVDIVSMELEQTIEDNQQCNLLIKGCKFLKVVIYCDDKNDLLFFDNQYIHME